ncbi:MAG: hypothetical protein ACLP1Q_09100 [Solirubrobacteraceae bacterium]
MAYSKEVEANVAFLEERAREAAQHESERSSALDQKTAGLIAAALVLLAAGVAFIANLDERHVGHGAKTFWTVLIVAVLVLLLASLIAGTWAISPRSYKSVHMDELNRWPLLSFLDRDPTAVRGEMLRAGVAITREARPINETKANRLTGACVLFGTAIVCIVVLASAVAIRLSDQPHHKTHVIERRHPEHAGRD